MLSQVKCDEQDQIVIHSVREIWYECEMGSREEADLKVRDFFSLDYF